MGFKKLIKKISFVEKENLAALHSVKKSRLSVTEVF